MTHIVCNTSVAKSLFARPLPYAISGSQPALIVRQAARDVQRLVGPGRMLEQMRVDDLVASPSGVDSVEDAITQKEYLKVSAVL